MRDFWTFLGIMLGLVQTGFAETNASQDLLIPATRACYETLTKNFTQDSRSEFVYMDDIYYHNDGFNPGGLKWAVLAAERMMQQIGCEVAKISLNGGDDLNRCVTLGYSEVCEVHSDAGYFVVVKDMVDTGHVIFNRYD